MFAEFDLLQWPLVIIKFGVCKEQKEFDAYLEKFTELYDLAQMKNEKFSLVFDARDAGIKNPTYLYQKAKYMKKMRSHSETFIYKTSVIITKWYVKGFLNIILSIQEPVTPYTVVKCYDDAIDWINKGIIRNKNCDANTVESSLLNSGE